ncbi:MAG: hypothetical protein Q7T21_02590, partial [Gallionella sp.]|nr:hypothetical protein [Gallionella sp.]
MTTWNQLGINEMTSLYLYGNVIKPTDLRSDAWIRNPNPNPIQMDAVSFMSSGPGRFANASNIRLVQAFLNGVFGFPDTGVRQTFTLAQAVARLGKGTENESIRQSDYQDSSNVLLLRSYIYQSSSFTIAKGAVFVIEANGDRYVQDFAILPFGDDFDFDSKSPGSKVANLFLKPGIDPTGIGRTVLIEFDAVSKSQVPRTTYTLADLAADTLRYQQSHASTDGLAKVAAALPTLVDGLWTQGVTRLLDAQGRLVFHGTNGADQLSPDKLNSSLMLGAAKTAIEKNGIAYIAGKNNDNITASTTNDYLDGGTGDDNLKGGFGTDTYVFKAGDGKDTIVDTDGNGQITVAGNALSGAALSDYKLLPGGQGQWSVNNGATVYTLDASHKQLVITGSSLGADSKITVN